MGLERSLAENIVRGRRAIELAQRRGMETAAWEESLAVLERQHLMAWAAELSEQGITLPNTVSYAEAPLRTVTTDRISWYAGHYLRTLSLSHLGQQAGRGWEPWTAAWWRGIESEALAALSTLREVVESLQLAERPKSQRDEVIAE